MTAHEAAVQEFLAQKRRYDPREVFVSDWYRHYVALMA